MKSFPDHISTMSISASEVEIETHDPDHRAHRLVEQLEAAFARRDTTDIATYARIVDQLMGEMSIMGRGFLEQPARAGRPPFPTRAHIPMTEAEEQRIVEHLALMCVEKA